MIRAIIWLGLVTYAISFAGGTVMAATAPTVKPVAPTPLAQTNNNIGQALEIGPPVITLTADPGQSLKTQISLRDISSGSLLVSGQVNDFVAAGEDGTPKLLLDNDSANPYSIKPWVAALPELTLKPKEIKQLPVTINVPKDASPGGHYGVVRFTATPPELKGTGVSLSASLGALVLIKVNGDVKESMTFESFTVSKGGKAGTLFESAPVSFTERIRNTGNTHEQPTGQVAITDMFGKKIASVNVNLPPRNVLPASIRKFEEPLDSTVIGNKKLFGRYKASVTVSYGSNPQTVSDSLTFWIIPYKTIAIIIIILVAGFFALRFMIKRYNQRIIKRAYGGKRR